MSRRIDVPPMKDPRRRIYRGPFGLGRHGDLEQQMKYYAKSSDKPQKQKLLHQSIELSTKPIPKWQVAKSWGTDRGAVVWVQEQLVQVKNVHSVSFYEVIKNVLKFNSATKISFAFL